MCTVTWWGSAEGYEVYFSRDELKSRLPALPPVVESLNGVRYLSPTDANAGGTWLLVNEFGLTVGLLNQYPEHTPAPEPPVISRGELVRSLADCRNEGEVLLRLQGRQLRHFEAFQLIAIEPGSTGSVHHWNRHQLKTTHNASHHLPYTSSSFQNDDVVRHRRKLFAEKIAAHGDMSPEDLQAFHREHDAGAGAFSVLMQRDDAETVSFSQIVVSADQITMVYAAKLSGRTAFAQSVSVSLKPRTCLA